MLSHGETHGNKAINWCVSLFLVGHFQLFSTSKENVDTKNMVYKMTLNGDGGRRFSFEGVKYVHKDHFGETGLKDTTTLFVKIFRLGKEEPLGNATLYITAVNFAKQLETMDIINTHSTREKLYWMARFGAFFAKTLWNVYGPVSSFDKYFIPDAPPRKKRPLRLRGCLPEVFNCTTDDKVKTQILLICFCRFLGFVTEISKKCNSMIVSWENYLILRADEMSQGHEIN